MLKRGDLEDSLDRHRKLCSRTRTSMVSKRTVEHAFVLAAILFLAASATLKLAARVVLTRIQRVENDDSECLPSIPPLAFMLITIQRL